MNIELISALAVFAFASSITPGPNNLMLMASGTNFGFVRTIPHMLGVGIGFVTMLILVGVGLVGLFDAFPVIYGVLKTVSIVYLLYLAWKIATAAPPTDTDATTEQTGSPMSFMQAALFQWVNPKALAMALTAVTAYTPPHHPISSVLIAGLVFGAINLPSVSVWVVLGTQLRRLLNNQRKLRIFNFGAAILLLASVYPILF